LDLDLHLLETVLPDGNEGCDAVLAVVEEDDHTIRVHGLASVELVVLEVGDDLLGETRGLGLEVLDGGLVSALVLEGLLNCLHVACILSVPKRVSCTGILTLEVGEVTLLVEAGLVQAERVDDVDLGLQLVIGTLLLLLSGSIGTSVYMSLVQRLTHLYWQYPPNDSPPTVILVQSASYATPSISLRL
jgi:hypothetical protein